MGGTQRDELPSVEPVGLGTTRATIWLPVAIVPAHRARRRARPQPLASGAARCLGERLVEGAVFGPKLLLRGGGESRFIVVGQHHEPHAVRSLPEPHGPMQRSLPGSVV